MRKVRYMEELARNEERDKHYEELFKVEKELFEAKLKNDALISALTSKDTELVVYNGDTYKITKLTFTESADSVDSLNLELSKVDTVISYNGGLVGTIQKAMDNVKNSLNVALYGNSEVANDK